MKTLLFFITITFSALSTFAEIVDVVILHTNDIHSQFAYENALLGTIQELREKYPESLLLDAGDVFESKVPKALMSEGLAVVDLMNQAGYDGITLGDNAFDGFSLQEIRDCIVRFQFPVLSANLVEADTGDPIALPYWIYSLQKATIAVIGIYNEEALNQAGVLIADPYKVTKYYVTKIKKLVDCVVLLSHQGLKNDRIMAERIEGIDVIVGGSSQKVLKQPEKVGNTIIVQAGAYAQFVGVLELQVDTTLNQIHAWQGYLKSTKE
ncbi:MAG: bifunctional metallophosphatase/5'-nucleotidase [bacterium]